MPCFDVCLWYKQAASSFFRVSIWRSFEKRKVSLSCYSASSFCRYPASNNTIEPCFCVRPQSLWRPACLAAKPLSCQLPASLLRSLASPHDADPAVALATRVTERVGSISLFAFGWVWQRTQIEPIPHHHNRHRTAHCAPRRTATTDTQYDTPFSQNKAHVHHHRRRQQQPTTTRPTPQR